MSFIDFREVSSPSTGVATMYGSQDLLDIMQIFNGKTVSQKRPRINNPWLWMGGQDMQEISEPAAPSAGTQRLYIDISDHHIKLKNSSSVVVDISAGGTPGTWNAATAETITNKTINATNNTITDVSTALGDILKSNGTKFIRFPKGTTGQVLTSTGTDIAWSSAGAGDMVLASTQTNSGAKTFNDTTLLLRNPANTFSATVGAGAQTAARTFTFPVTAASDTIQTIAATQTQTNKTISIDLNTINHSTTNTAGEIVKSDGTKYVRFPRGTANQVLAMNGAGNDLLWTTPAGGGNVSTTSSNTYQDFDQIFRSARVKIRNPADTFSYSLVGSAITASMNISLPLLTFDDTMVCEAFAQTLTAKTINATSNTITDTSTATGDLLKSNGTKFVRFPLGSPNQVLTTNGTGTDLAWATGGGGGTGDMLLGTAQTVTANKTFNDTTLLLRNPGNTFSATLGAGAQTAARTFTLPVTASDTLLTAAATQTVTGKTIDYNSNTILNLPSGGGNVSTGTPNTFGAFDNIFRSGNFKLTNPANTFNYAFVGSAITAARNVTLPLLTADDTLVTAAFAQTLTNKTISGASNTFSNIPDAALSANVDLINTNQTITGVDTFNDQTIKLRNPANTFSYTLTHGAITADRTLNLPVITATDTLDAVATAATLTNKTLNATNNTITDTSTVTGDLLKSNGTKFVRMGVGLANQVLTTNASANDLIWTTPSGGGGSSAGFPGNILTVASDGSGDYSTVQAAINASTTGTLILIGPGDYSTASTLNLDGKNRLTIKGAGVGVTRLITTDTSIKCIHAHGSATGSSLPLTANTLKKSNVLTMSSGNAATLAINDWILLRSTKQVDVELGPFFAGELHQVRAISAGTVTMDDRVVEDYNTTDSASVIKILMMEDITFQDMTIMTNAVGGASTLHDGSCQFRFNKNLTFFNVEITNVGWAGLHIISCAAPLVSNCDIHDINYDAAVQALNYGIVLQCATRDAIVSNCNFKRTRHAITAGGDSGTNFEGYVLNSLISNCISLETNTAHFDCHQACRYTTYIGCKAAGGTAIPPATQMGGFQTRAPYTKYLECTSVDIPGIALYAYGDTTSAAAPNKADDLVVENCDFIFTKFDTGTAHGHGIFVDNFLQRARIIGCRINNSDGVPITLNQENDNCVIQNNIIFNTTTTTSNAIDCWSCDDILCTGNRISGCARGIRIQTQGGGPAPSNNWIIDQNDFTGCTNLNGTYTSQTNIKRLVGDGVCNIPAQT